MSPWLANALGLLLASSLAWFAALALLWRVGSWQVRPAATLNLDKGLPVGTEAPEIAGSARTHQVQLTWGHRLTLVVFGTRGCKPCKELIDVAPAHPATRNMRLVYVSNEFEDDLDERGRWEIYTFDDERDAREMWNAPVSPYFHVIDPNGRIAEKGIANAPEHLDRLLAILPPGVSPRIALAEIIEQREGRSYLDVR
jgi:hypothetical protein